VDKLPRKPRCWQRRLVRWGRKQKDDGVLLRAQIVAFGTSSRSSREIAELLGCAVSCVYAVADRFLAQGRDGLLDGRRVSRRQVADAEYDTVVEALVNQSPQDFGYSRPTWTRELLILVAEEQTGKHVSLSSMSRVLKRIRARRGRPKPIVICPLSKRQKRRRLRQIRLLVENLPEDEVAVYEDEADVHLNPKIGLDWMNRGRQKVVVTPGVNQKAYLAGALDVRDGTLTWVGAPVKNTSLFVQLLEKLCERYPHARRIHVILDNYGIHHSHEARRAVWRLQRICLHFLPSYCPDHNKIERLWEDLHANVTRNHRHNNLLDLCADVATWLNAASPWPARLRIAISSTPSKDTALATAA
jgi:transposase